jgi:hypothetical protein
MHSDDSVFFIVILIKLTGIIKPDPCNYLPVGILQLDLDTIGLVSGRTAIKQNAITADSVSHAGPPVAR